MNGCDGDTRYEELSESFKKALIAKVQTVSPFWGLLGMELVDIKKGWAEVRLPFDRKLTHAFGIAHSGSVFAPADSAVAMALLGLVEEGKGLVPWLQEISEALQERAFKTQAAKRVYIEKPEQSGKFRPLGIPTIRDRMVQGPVRL
jgi:hypothetical protein